MVPEHRGKNVMAEGRGALALLCILLVLSFKLEDVAISDVILRTKCYFSARSDTSMFF